MSAVLPLLAVVEDCEAVRAGLLGQPANTVSSLSFVALGIWLLTLARRSPARALEIRLFAAASLLTGLGSVVFHGPHPAWGQWAHDVPIAAGLLLAVVVDVAALTGRRRRELAAWVAGTLAIAVLLAVAPDAQRPVFVLTGLAFAGLEAVAVRRHLRPWPGDHDFGLWLLVVAAFALGVAAFGLGRLEGFCDPTSPLQLHAAWHVLEAVAIGAYVHVAVAEIPTQTRAGR